MGTPFKMKGSPFQRNFGVGSPLKQDSKKTFERIQRMRSKAKDWLKKLDIKKIAKTGVRSNVLGLMFGATTTATADQPKKGKGAPKYPGGKIDFTKNK